MKKDKSKRHKKSRSSGGTSYSARSGGLRVTGFVDVTVRPAASPFAELQAPATLLSLRIVRAQPPSIDRQNPYSVEVHANLGGQTLNAWFIAFEEDDTHDLPMTSFAAAASGIPRRYTLTFDTTDTRLTTGKQYILQVAIVDSSNNPLVSCAWNPIAAA
jgi:hypothetical protein